MVLVLAYELCSLGLGGMKGGLCFLLALSKCQLTINSFLTKIIATSSQDNKSDLRNSIEFEGIS